MSYQYNRHRHISNPNRSLQRQEGVVIIMALFIVALVAAMAYAMMARLSRDTQQTTQLVRHVEAENYAQGSIAWAMDKLRSNLIVQKPNQLVDAIPIQSVAKTVNGYEVQSTIYDLQSRFNLNNVKDKKSQNQLMRLIRLVAPNTSPEQAMAIVNATVDWITPAANNNEFSKYYLGLPQPYRTAHRPMLNASELSLVKGMTPKLYHALQPYIVALPTTTQVNIQTASAPVLASLSDQVSLQDANSIIELRKNKPLNNNPKSYDLDVISSGRFPLGDVVVVSQYFLVETKVSIENDSILLYTLLYRVGKDGKAAVSMFGQSKGTW